MLPLLSVLRKRKVFATSMGLATAMLVAGIFWSVIKSDAEVVAAAARFELSPPVVVEEASVYADGGTLVLKLRDSRGKLAVFYHESKMSDLYPPGTKESDIVYRATFTQEVVDKDAPNTTYFEDPGLAGPESVDRIAPEERKAHLRPLDFGGEDEHAIAVLIRAWLKRTPRSVGTGAEFEGNTDLKASLANYYVTNATHFLKALERRLKPIR
ncbi:MAG: hypothetical protein K1Y02_20125 [Candidatus Hydrogenedentes bacterium]|nr:hypothetical protein [Candidatus Hydrogenedentota bacterium]